MTTLLEAVKVYCTITQVGRGKSTAYKIEFGHFEARAATQGEALAKLMKKMGDAVEGEYRPVMIAFRAEYVLIYRDPISGWGYIGPMAPGKENRYASTSGLTREEAERQARFALAQKVWDGEETNSPIILNEKDQADFRSAAIHMIENKVPDPMSIKEQVFWQQWNARQTNAQSHPMEECAVAYAYYLREYIRCQPNCVASNMMDKAVTLQESNPLLAEAFVRYANDLYEWAGIEDKYRHVPARED